MCNFFTNNTKSIIFPNFLIINLKHKCFDILLLGVKEKTEKGVKKLGHKIGKNIAIGLTQVIRSVCITVLKL